MDRALRIAADDASFWTVNVDLLSTRWRIVIDHLKSPTS